MALTKTITYQNEKGEIYYKETEYIAVSSPQSSEIYARIIVQRLTVNSIFCDTIVVPIYVLPFGVYLNLSTYTKTIGNIIYRQITSGPKLKNKWIKVGQLVDGEETVEYI